MDVRKSGHSESAWMHVAAGLTALAIVALLARLLWHLPDAAPGHAAGRMQVRWLVRPALPVLPGMPPPVPSDAPAAVPSPPALSVASRPPPVQRTAAATTPAITAAPRLYGTDGRVALPAEMAGKHGTRAPAERVFEHRDELQTGVGERATAGLFSRSPAGTRQSRAQRLIYGDDIQAAEARRPPEVAFNPALHERSSDLGSEATGDAYKAAPVRHEPLPGLGGEASRRIRAAIGDLERRHPRCAAAQRGRWLAPALQHLEALQRLEYRYNNGADPVEAEHSLPAAAESAYDLARRALWDAGRRMQACG